MQYVLLVTAAIAAMYLAVCVTKMLYRHMVRRSLERHDQQEAKHEVQTARRVTERTFENLPSRDIMRHDFMAARQPLPDSMQIELKIEFKSIKSAIGALVERFEELNGKIVCMKASKITAAQYREFRSEYHEITRSVAAERARFDLLIASTLSKVDSLTVRRRKLRLCKVGTQLLAFGPVLDRLAARGVDIRKEDTEVCMMRALTTKLQGEISREEVEIPYGKSHLKSLDKIATLEGMVLDIQTRLERKTPANLVTLVK